jgi:hypothetical protein
MRRLFWLQFWGNRFPHRLKLPGSDQKNKEMDKLEGLFSSIDHGLFVCIAFACLNLQQTDLLFFHKLAERTFLFTEQKTQGPNHSTL